MNVNIKNYSCLAKNLRIKSKCPDSCYNTANCARINGKRGKCRSKNRCRCIPVEKRRNMNKCRTQAKLDILSKSVNTQRINDGLPPKSNCEYKKPIFKKMSDTLYYNKIYTWAYNSIKKRFLGTRHGKTKVNREQKRRLHAYARQYTVMWLRRFASSQGPTVDGWPATTLVGDNRNHFSEVQDGYATNCCLPRNGSQIAFVRKALTNPTTFCRLTNNKKCSQVYCQRLKRIAQRRRERR